MTDGSPNGMLEDLTVMTRISRLMAKLDREDREAVADWVFRRYGQSNARK